jgi:phosphoribosylamine--glycine ligase
MNILVVGGGGREHALCWKLSQSPYVTRVFCTPGNAGIEEDAVVKNISANDTEGVLRLCRDEGIDLVVIGPEKPLISGMADRLRDAGFLVYGPNKKAAMMEGSKAFAKLVMLEEGIPTAKYESFINFESAQTYIKKEFKEGRKVVVKASGEALGKGVVVCDCEEQAISAAEAMLIDGVFGDAGKTVVIEERLEGREMSLMAVCNGEGYVLLPPAQDYKSAFDNGEGPNTGGMGAYCPISGITDEEIRTYGETFIKPVLQRFLREGIPFIGTLYAGLMLTDSGAKALEYNVRFGDPETQVVLPLIESDFMSLLYSASQGKKLDPIQTYKGACVCVVIVSKGYPGEYEKGLPIPDLSGIKTFKVFHAGTEWKNKVMVNFGGRVLNLVEKAETVQLASESLYGKIDNIFKHPWRYRKDIGM